MRFWKGQALGNDYLVVEAAEPAPTGVIRGLCDRHRGAGSDGVLFGAVEGAGDGGGVRDGRIRLRIFNPDGTEAEKSGNGLRIFGAWLHYRGLVGAEPFRVHLPGEAIEMRVVSEEAGVRVLRVAMGRARFDAGSVHYDAAPADAEVMGEAVEVRGERLPLHLVSMGNPHCVVLLDTLDSDHFRRFAPSVQALPAFTRGVNVQFARVVGPNELEAMIWERGVGETLASGSSACAVAAAAVRSGRVAAGSFIVRMPGGELGVEVGDDWAMTLTGPAQVVYEGRVEADVVAGWSAVRSGPS